MASLLRQLVEDGEHSQTLRDEDAQGFAKSAMVGSEQACSYGRTNPAKSARWR